MKRIIIIAVLLALFTVAQAQTPVGAKVRFDQTVYFLQNSSTLLWATYASYEDTVAVGATNVMTGPFSAPNAAINFSTTAILAATDSCRCILWGSNIGNLTQDTLRAVKLDSVSIRAAGYQNYVFITAGKYKPYLWFEFVKKGSTSTSKLTRTSIGVE